jgi:hypothetical protein
MTLPGGRGSVRAVSGSDGADIRDDRPLAVAGVDRRERLVLRYLAFETRGVQDVAGDGGRQWLAGEVDRFTRAPGEDATTGERDYLDLTAP